MPGAVRGIARPDGCADTMAREPHIRTDVRKRRGLRVLRVPRALALVAGAALGLSGCAGGGATVIATGPVTIEFATQGLGQEGDATNRAIAAFERADPRVHVNVLTLSPLADVAYRQLTERLT